MKQPINSIYKVEDNISFRLPLYLTRIPAGFPSPADAYIDQCLDLNEYLIKRPSATFFIRVSGDSMTGAGIYSEDILIVDRAETARSRSIVIAAINGELTVKRLIKEHGRIFLAPENRSYDSMEVLPDMEFQIWGVVIHVIRSF